MRLHLARLFCFAILLPFSFGIASSEDKPKSLFKVGEVPAEVRSRLKLSDFYQKYCDVEGLPIVASSKVEDAALLEAQYLVRSMLAGNSELTAAIRDHHVRIAIMASEEQTVDIPEHSDLKPADYWNKRARGLGATAARPATSAGAENLLHLPKDRYVTENILIHEFAHTIHQMGLRHTDSNFQSKLDAAFQNAKAKELWAKTYAISNVDEYWAEGVQSYFDANRANDDQHNDIDTREKLANYDPQLFALIDEAFRKNPWRYEGRVRTFLEEAGDNRESLVDAWRSLLPERRVGLKFLFENMPESDLKSLSGQFLIEHVNGAYDAIKEAPWSNAIPQEVFLNGILPYANVSERRDAWRKDFHDRFTPVVAGIATPGEAAAKINQNISSMLDVRYSTKRKRADQSPYESIETHTASCTGLSILLIDACRSVGVPARFVGTPLWADKSGNHSWVEVWNDGDWHFTGACEPAGNQLDAGWFIARASEAKIDEPRHAIYAVSFKKTPLLFPMVWDRVNQTTYGVNVTSRYTSQRKPLEVNQIRVRFKVIDRDTQKRIATRLEVLDTSGVVLLDTRSRDEGFDSNDHVELVVNKDQQLMARIDGSTDSVSLQAISADQLFTLEK